MASDLALLCLLILLYKKLPTAVDLAVSQLKAAGFNQTPKQNYAQAVHVNHPMYDIPYNLEPVQGVVVGQPIDVAKGSHQGFEYKKSLDF